jgi:hypothetical protein
MPIDALARLLAMHSLDEAAKFIGHAWLNGEVA